MGCYLTTISTLSVTLLSLTTISGVIGAVSAHNHPLIQSLTKQQLAVLDPTDGDMCESPIGNSLLCLGI